MTDTRNGVITRQEGNLRRGKSDRRGYEFRKAEGAVEEWRLKSDWSDAPSLDSIFVRVKNLFRCLLLWWVFHE